MMICHAFVVFITDRRRRSNNIKLTKYDKCARIVRTTIVNRSTVSLFDCYSLYVRVRYCIDMPCFFDTLLLGYLCTVCLYVCVCVCARASVGNT